MISTVIILAMLCCSCLSFLHSRDGLPMFIISSMQVILGQYMQIVDTSQYSLPYSSSLVVSSPSTCSVLLWHSTLILHLRKLKMSSSLINNLNGLNFSA